MIKERDIWIQLAPYRNWFRHYLSLTWEEFDNLSNLRKKLEQEYLEKFNSYCKDKYDRVNIRFYVEDAWGSWVEI